jgi:phosphoglycolate phosphatase-like HAD superfamily hydrolase
MNKGIIFDFDGVICDSVNVKTEAFAAMYKPYGDDVVNKVMQYHLEHGGISRYDKFRYYHNELLKVALTDKDVMKLGEIFSSISLQKVIDSNFLPGVLDFIKESYKVANLFICTGTPETEIRIILDKKGLTKYFKGIYGAPKKKSNIIREIMQTYQMSGDQLEFYGDAMTDYNAAKETNIKFIGVYSNSTSFPLGTDVITDFINIKKHR